MLPSFGLCLLLALPAAGQAPAVDETWPGLAPPVAGEGDPTLTVVLRGASEAVPVRAGLGEVEGQLSHLGLAVFALTLRGVPEEGELVVSVGEREAWRGPVRAGDEALVLLNSRGRRFERLPAATEPLAEAPARSPLMPAAWLLLCLGAVGLATRGRR